MNVRNWVVAPQGRTIPPLLGRLRRLRIAHVRHADMPGEDGAERAYRSIADHGGDLLRLPLQAFASTQMMCIYNSKADEFA